MAGFVPNPGPQEAFLRSPAFEVFFGGHPYGGKSEALVVDALGLNAPGRPQVLHPEYRGRLFRRTEDQLGQLIAYARRHYPSQGGRETENGRVWRWRDGGEIILSHMHGRDDYLQHQGFNLTYVAFDELPQFTEDQYGGIIPWVRPGAPDLTAYLRASGNPIGPGVPWVRRRFITACRPMVVHVIQSEFEGQTYTTTRQFIPSSFRDNVQGLTNDPQYVGRLAQHPNATVRAALMSPDPVTAWGIVMGAFFSAFTNATHVIPRSEERHVRARLRDTQTTKVEGLDYGYSNPFAVVWAWQDRERQLTVTDEYYVRRQTLETHTRAIHARRQALGWEDEAGTPVTPFLTVADPSIWYEGNRSILKTDQTIGQELAARGVYTLKANNQIITGLRVVQEALQVGVDTPPRFQVFESCESLIEELVNATTSEGDAERITEGDPDHALDCLRYLSLYLTDVSAVPVGGPPDPTWTTYFDRDRARPASVTYARSGAQYRRVA